jgi:hypothetical protein
MYLFIVMIPHAALLFKAALVLVLVPVLSCSVARSVEAPHRAGFGRAIAWG